MKNSHPRWRAGDRKLFLSKGRQEHRAHQVAAFAAGPQYVLAPYSALKI